MLIKQCAGIALLVLGIGTTTACRSSQKAQTWDYAQVSQNVAHASWASEQLVAATNPVVLELEGAHPVDHYIRFALTQNPGIQAARSRVDAAAHRVPQAASLDDPTLEITGWPITENAPQTASGRMTVDTMVSQEVPWFGKLRTRANAAVAEVNAARAQLAARELEVIEQVKRAYYQLHFVEQSIRINDESRRRFLDVVDTANTRQQTGEVGLQDVLRLQAQLASIDAELVQLQQERSNARADLAQLLHVSPETTFETVAELPDEDIPRDIEQLYERAVAARPELHAALAEIDRDRLNVELAQLNYFPDVAFRAGWSDMTTNRAIAPTADGLDNLSAGIMLNLPVYRKRIEAGVREAEAQTVASAREYDQMRDQTLREVKSLFSQVKTQHEIAGLLRDSIIPSYEQAFELSLTEYQTGQTTYVQMIDNWRELLRFRLMHQQIEAQLRQSLASLARMIGDYELSQSAAPEPLPSPDDPPTN